MVNMNLDIANNLAAFIVSIVTLGAFMVTVISWLIGLQKDQKAFKEAATTRISNLEDALADHKIGVAGEYNKMEVKMDSFQATMNLLVQGVARIQGAMEASGRGSRDNKFNG